MSDARLDGGMLSMTGLGGSISFFAVSSVRNRDRAGHDGSLVAAVGGYVWFGRPARLDLDQLHERGLVEVMNRPDALNDWLAETKVRVPRPADFDYALLRHYGMADLQGKRVPMLLFSRVKDGSHVEARVYLLSSDQFDFAALAVGATGFSSGLSIAFLPHPTDPRYGYLVLYTGESLDPFLVQQQFSST